MTVRGEAPGRVTQLLPAESVAMDSPSPETLPANQSRASRQIGPQHGAGYVEEARIGHQTNPKCVVPHQRVMQMLRSQVRIPLA